MEEKTMLNLEPKTHSDLQAKNVGLISDTHIPTRAKEIPLKVFKMFEDIDFIIHAGDLVQLEVLDELPVMLISRDDAMIDTHCHLEQPDYDKDRDALIAECKQKLQAIITSCANPKYFDLTMQLVSRYKGFVFSTTSVHPKYVKEISEEEIGQYIERIKSNKESIVAIGETGLDYNWVKGAEWQKKQRQLFERLIGLAQQQQLPLVIHSRDATEDVVEILEQHKEKRVQMHMFSERSLLKRVIDNGWLISVNTLLLRSKSVRQIVRDCPLEQLMLETDSPWLGIGRDGKIKPKNEVRNKPTAVRLVAEKIAEIKKIGIELVDKQTTNNAIDFFKICIESP